MNQQLGHAKARVLKSGFLGKDDPGKAAVSNHLLRCGMLQPSFDAKNQADRRRLAIALGINLAMFVIGLVGWRLARSTALLADAFDMLADASGYAICYLAVGGSARRQRIAARWSGVMLMALGIAVVVEAAHRWMAGADEPRGIWIMAFALLSLLANGCVLVMLREYRDAPEVHLRATWIDTRADVLVNVGVLVAGFLVALTNLRVIDLIAGILIAGFAIHEGWELFEGEDAD